MLSRLHFSIVHGVPRAHPPRLTSIAAWGVAGGFGLGAALGRGGQRRRWVIATPSAGQEPQERTTAKTL